MTAGIRERGPELKEMVKGLSFLKKIAEPEEVAEIVAFVASPAAGWIIGERSEVTSQGPLINPIVRQSDPSKWRRIVSGSELAQRLLK